MEGKFINPELFAFKCLNNFCIAYKCIPCHWIALHLRDEGNPFIVNYSFWIPLYLWILGIIMHHICTHFPSLFNLTKCFANDSFFPIVLFSFSFESQNMQDSYIPACQISLKPRDCANGFACICCNFSWNIYYDLPQNSDSNHTTQGISAINCNYIWI